MATTEEIRFSFTWIFFRKIKPEWKQNMPRTLDRCNKVNIWVYFSFVANRWKAMVLRMDFRMTASTTMYNQLVGERIANFMTFYTTKQHNKLSLPLHNTTRTTLTLYKHKQFLFTSTNQFVYLLKFEFKNCTNNWAALSKLLPVDVCNLL